MLALGIIGAFLPVMPTTIFIIFAAWFFARSSPKLEARLLADQRFGPLVINGVSVEPFRHVQALCLSWYDGRLWPVLVGRETRLAAIPVTVFMLGSAVYVLSRPSE